MPVFIIAGLAFIMFAMGLGLGAKNFRDLVRYPKAALLGLSLQLVLLPLCALLVISLLPLPAMLAAGLCLIAVCPGGITSNLMSQLSRGDVALSVSLTAIISLLSPFTMPFVLVLLVQQIDAPLVQFSVPLIPTIKQLLLVTLVPMLAGMLVTARFPVMALRWQPVCVKVSGVIFVAFVVMLTLKNWAALPAVWSWATVACLLLCVMAMAISFVCGRLAKLNGEQTVTIMIEVGIQNAATAMMLALTILDQPNWANTAIFYGLLMNVPAGMIIAYRRYGGALCQCKLS